MIELLQDEENEVLQASGVALAVFILSGHLEWLDRFFQLIKDKKIHAVTIIEQLPKVLKATNSVSTKLVIEILK